MIILSHSKKNVYIFPVPTKDDGKILIYLKDNTQDIIETPVLKGKMFYSIPENLRNKIIGVELI